MENEIQQNVLPVQPLPQPPSIVPSSTNWSKILIFITLGLVAIVGSIFVGIQIGKNQTPTQQTAVIQKTISPVQIITITPTDIPETITPKVSILPTATIIPTSAPSPRPFSEEEKLIRKTFAGFEMYVGNSNTAGALSFFTPPISDVAKQTLNRIKTQNLPYKLTSWKSFEKDYTQNYELDVENIKNGYRVRMTECRTNANECSLLFLELVRNETAENGFLIDRYYDTSYAYQNNLGEEIKYQGFRL